MKIGVAAPGSRIDPALPDRIRASAAALYPGRAPEIIFHPQCFLAAGHFAGDDSQRAAGFLDIANDASIDALWFGRGGYGSCRIADAVIANLGAAARKKIYLGYSDAGSMLAGLYRHGIGRIAHGPMPTDLNRADGEAAVSRALKFLMGDASGTLEPHVGAGAPAAAFNITILSHLLGTPLEPDLAGHVLMLEEVSEHLYRIDRAFFHITSNAAIRRVAGIKLGRCSAIPPNEPEFGQTEEDIARHWCAVSGIPYLGRADIGHDGANKIVPFGNWSG